MTVPASINQHERTDEEKEGKKLSEAACPTEH